MKKNYEPFVPGMVRCCVCGVDEPEDTSDFDMHNMMHVDCYENPDDYDDYDDDDDYYDDGDD